MSRDFVSAGRLLSVGVWGGVSITSSYSREAGSQSVYVKCSNEKAHLLIE